MRNREIRSDNVDFHSEQNLLLLRHAHTRTRTHLPYYHEATRPLGYSKRMSLAMLSDGGR